MAKYLKIFSITLILLLIFGCSQSSTNSNDSNQLFKEENSSNAKIIVENNVAESIDNEISSNNLEINSNDASNNIEENNLIEASYSQEDENTIQTFNNIEKEVDDILVNEDNTSALDKAKGIFITLVDFIFYDGEINGNKFDDLTNQGKQKILEITSRIDIKIENKFPNYKDTISNGTKNAFQKCSELIQKGATNINDFAKDKLGSDNYEAIINAKDELVKYTKNAISIIGNVSSNIFTKTKDTLNSWYQTFKNNNT